MGRCTAWLERRARRRSTGHTLVFEPSAIEGAWIIDLQPRLDERGFFARSWCRREFEDHGIDLSVAQANISVSARRGTLRGLHYQLFPHAEAKLVRCTSGGIWDVIVDLRPDSSSYLRWFGVELTAANHRQLYVPSGCAHGYQTLVDATEVCYQVSAFYTPEAERGIRWDDPMFAIEWPISAPILSPKDEQWPPFTRPTASEIESSRG